MEGKQLKLKYKEDFKKMVRDKWKEKAMHQKFSNYLDKDHVDEELSFEWMKHTGLKGETEGLITAAQDQVLNTRYYSKLIIKQGTADICRMCHTHPETVEHIISGCQTLAAYQYLKQAQPSSCPVTPGHMQALWHQSGSRMLVST